MISLVQRVDRAVVRLEDEEIAAIGRGLLVLLGVDSRDGPDDARWLAAKIAGLRLFEDEAGRMNRSVADVGGALLVVSQFTLLGDCRRGRRPSFSEAAPPDGARPLYELFLAELRTRDLPLACGRFGAHMKVELVNDGPVTLMVGSRSWTPTGGYGR